MQQYRLKTSDNRGATMIELMAMLAILGLGVSAMFAVVTSGIYFAKDTEDNIKAINLAREGIEGVTNIRNTNWLRFSSDRTNCWKVDNYASNCIGLPIGNVANVAIHSGSNILYTNNGLWYLSGTTSIDATSNWSGYASAYAVSQDGNGFFNQTGSIGTLPLCTSTLQKNCRAIFTREMIITAFGTDTLSVRSIVKWNTKSLHSLELQSTLTNWKAKF